MLIAKNIKKNYGNLQVLKGIDLEISQGEIISIVGASGAGKTTLLHILGTLDKADSGAVFLGDINYNSLKDKELAKITDGEFINALATATLCCSPPESSEGKCLIRSSKPSIVNISSAFWVVCALFFPLIQAGIHTFSTAVNSGIRL